MSNGLLRGAFSFLSNYAALLCLIDCIVLPVLIAILRLLDIFTDLEPVLHFSHIVEIVLVIPLGTFSVIHNYLKHRIKKLAAAGLLGVALVVGAHLSDKNWLEITLSLVGCTLLVGSNFISRRRVDCCGEILSNTHQPLYPFHHVHAMHAET